MSHWAGRRLDRPHLGSSVGQRVSGWALSEAPRGGKPRYLMTWGQEGGLKPGWVGAGWGWQMDGRTELTRPAGVFEAPSERGPEVRRPA